jgi:hypothetical protein
VPVRGVGQVGGVYLEHGVGGQLDTLVGVLADAAHRDEAADRCRVGGQRARSGAAEADGPGEAAAVQADGGDDAPVRGELVPPGGHEVPCLGGDDDPVVRGLAGVAEGAVGTGHAHVRVARAAEVRLPGR